MCSSPSLLTKLPPSNNTYPVLGWNLEQVPYFFGSLLDNIQIVLLFLHIEDKSNVIIRTANSFLPRFFLMLTWVCSSYGSLQQSTGMWSTPLSFAHLLPPGLEGVLSTNTIVIWMFQADSFSWAILWFSQRFPRWKHTTVDPLIPAGCFLLLPPPWASMDHHWIGCRHPSQQSCGGRFPF